MKENNQSELQFPIAGGKKVVADFEGGTTSSDAGFLLLRETERKVGIINRLTIHSDIHNCE
jgi:hypothetical protein